MLQNKGGINIHCGVTCNRNYFKMLNYIEYALSSFQVINRSPSSKQNTYLLIKASQQQTQYSYARIMRMKLQIVLPKEQ